MPIEVRRELKIKIFHNPRCSKSRQTLNLLRDRKVEFDTVEYLSAPPDAEELRRILELLDLSPRQLMRKNEQAYKSENLDDADLSDDELINAMVRNPILIQRPIAIAGDQAIIGRPPENVLKLL